MKWVCVFTALLLLGRMGFAQEMTKIDPRNIRLGGEIGRRIDVTVNNNHLDGVSPRLFALNPDTLEGPVPDDSVRPGGLSCTVGVWRPEVFYPSKISQSLTLTEFADPGCEHVYFHVPNPGDKRFMDDELFANAAE